MSRSVKYRLIATMAVTLGVGAVLYAASPVQAAPPSPPSGAIAQLQAEIDALQQQVDQQALVIATKQNIINGTCSQGQHFSQVNADGNVVCTSDTVHLTLVSDTRHLDRGEVGDIVLSCPAGTSATGGGFEQINVGIFASMPWGSGWKVTGAANIIVSGDFNAFAICASNTP
jgi:hypothetical protein